MRATFSGDVSAGYKAFHAAAEIGVLFRDSELAALARIGEGRCLIYLDRVDEGVALLDEGMVAIEANDVSAIAIGDAYCTVIEGCNELFDVRRGHAWTASLSHWVDGQPELHAVQRSVPYPSRRVAVPSRRLGRRSRSNHQACRRLAQPIGHPALGAVAYLKGDLYRLLKGDLYRLRGQDHAAEAEFRLA
jgi:hypothetical protein